MKKLLDWIGRHLFAWVAGSALLLVASTVALMMAYSASYRAPAGQEQPKITDWMQAWGSIAGVFASLAAALAAVALLLHERAAVQEARQQLAEEKEANRRKEMRASIEVRSEQYRRIEGSRVGTEQRYVVKNHGPAEAHAVVVVFIKNGEPVELDLIGWNHRPNTPLLHPGEELHMNYISAMGDEKPEKVVVNWLDDRPGRQVEEFYPSHRDL